MPDPVQQWQASHPGVPVPWYVQEQETGGVSNGNVPGGIVNSSIDPNPGTAQTASQSTATSNPYSNATDYGDQTAWGGHYLGAAQAYDQSQQLASQAASLGSTQAVGLGLLGQQYAQQGAGYQGNAQTAFNQGNAAYAQGTNAVGLLGNAAAGKGPSAAQAQLTQGTDAAIAAEQAQGASVRGANGLANAGYQASQQGGQALLQASNQSAQLRAQEQQAAQAQYAQAATSLAGASYGASGQQGSLANQAYGQQLGATTAGDTAQQNMLGLQQGYTNQGDQVNTAAANTALGRLGLSQQQNQFTAAQQTQDIGAGLSAGGTVIGAAATMTSDENAKTNVDAPAGYTEPEDPREKSPPPPATPAPPARTMKPMRPATGMWGPGSILPSGDQARPQRTSAAAMAPRGG